MKKFFTPAIDGQYSTAAQVRLEDVPDHVAYAHSVKLLGNTNDLDGTGYVKLLTKDHTGKITGYITYQQDNL